MSFCSVFIYMGAFDSRWTLAMDTPVSLTDFNSEFAFRICFFTALQELVATLFLGQTSEIQEPQ